MSWQIYIALSLMMYFEYSVRGSWAPVLSARLLGPLGMSGKQAGWIYSMYPLMCIAAPLIAGQIVDRWIATEYFMGAAHFVSGCALLIAARMTKFRWLLLLIGIHCFFYAPSLGLVNSLAFTHLENPKTEYFWVRVWGSIGWMAVGWMLSLWRRSEKFPFAGSDALLLASIFSFGMAIYCPLFLPHTPPPGSPDWASTWKPLCEVLSNPNFLIFLAISLVTTTQLQFYFFGTSRFLEDIGCRNANIPALMSLAQMAEIVATAQVLPLVLPRLGYQWTLTIGPLLWGILYVMYVIQKPRWLVITSMTLHGFAFAFFFDAGIVYVNHVSPPEIRATVQSLYIVATLGLGMFCGAHLTGFVVDRFRVDGKPNWRRVYMVPCVTLAAVVLAFIVFFSEHQ